MYLTFNKGRLLLAAVALALFGFGAAPATADTDQEILVTEAQWTLEKLLKDEKLGNMPKFLNQARAVYIVPSLYKGGFVLGAEGGKGVVLAKGADGTWSSPAFYTLAGGSIGLQIGGQVSEVVFTIMNEAALKAIIEDNFKLGGDVSIAMGPIGAGIEAGTTTNFEADVYAFSHAVGLYGGGSIEGSAILNDDDDNQTYYGTAAAPEAILLERRFNNPQAEPLRKLLPGGAGNTLLPVEGRRDILD